MRVLQRARDVERWLGSCHADTAAAAMLHPGGHVAGHDNRPSPVEQSGESRR